jgi:anti-sigma B factor antagonist
MQQASFAIDIRYPASTIVVLDIEGDLTAAAEAALSGAYAETDSARVEVVVLNFNELEYMNSSGIGLLVTLLVRVNRNNQRLVATGLNDHYQQIFEVTRLSEAIEIFATEADALALATA